MAVSSRKAFVGQVSPRADAWSNVAVSHRCGSSEERPHASRAHIRVVPRSAYGIFEFLGNLIKIQREHLEPLEKAHLPPVPPGEPDEAEVPPTLLTTDNQELITVLQNTGGNCFSHTWFFDGDYCVPEEATNTKRIFSLLAQLIAIETAATDLSITPVVRVIQ